jgi:hypothetical protein
MKNWPPNFFCVCLPALSMKSCMKNKVGPTSTFHRKVAWKVGAQLFTATFWWKVEILGVEWIIAAWHKMFARCQVVSCHTPFESTFDSGVKSSVVLIVSTTATTTFMSFSKLRWQRSCLFQNFDDIFRFWWRSRRKKIVHKRKSRLRVVVPDRRTLYCTVFRSRAAVLLSKTNP